MTGGADRHGGLARGVVLMIDEAGMAPTRITARLFEHAQKAGAKIIAVGDAGQLTSVEAGGWFAALAHDHGGRDAAAGHAPARPCRARRPRRPP